MNNLINKIGLIAALLGVVVCVLAGVLRLLGSYHIAGIESQTVFMVGMAGMLISILIKQNFQN